MIHYGRIAVVIACIALVIAGLTFIQSPLGIKLAHLKFSTTSSNPCSVVLQTQHFAGGESFSFTLDRAGNISTSFAGNGVEKDVQFLYLGESIGIWAGQGVKEGQSPSYFNFSSTVQAGNFTILVSSTVRDVSMIEPLIECSNP